MTSAKTCTILAVSLLASACDAASQNNTIPASDSALPANAGAAPAKEAAATARALSAYAGELPYDPVDGVAFVDRPEVRAAVESLVADAEIRRWLLSKNVTTRPIELANGRILAGACEPHNCGPHEWTIAIGADGSAPEICYHNHGQSADSARWYAAGREPETRPGPCTPVP